MTVTEEILHLYQRGGNDAYFGEDVTQLQHALQAAASAVDAHADDELVVAALLHDIGHLLPGDNYQDEIGVVDHDKTCIAWLAARGFSARLIALVSGHVSAKRYLVTTQAQYRDRLSPTSQRTLELQGGIMTPEEVAGFEAHPHFRDVLRLRGRGMNWQKTPVVWFRTWIVTYFAWSRCWPRFKSASGRGGSG